MGTQDVENMSKKLIKNVKGISRDQGFINYVMTRRWEDAKKALKRANADYRGTMKYLATVVPDHVMMEFCRFMRVEVGKVWDEKVQRMIRKIRMLEERNKPWKKPVDPIIEGIKITDTELEQLEALEAETVVPVYGDVEVPQEVKEAAALPPKFALHPNVDIKNVETDGSTWQSSTERGGGCPQSRRWRRSWSVAGCGTARPRSLTSPSSESPSCLPTGG